MKTLKYTSLLAAALMSGACQENSVFTMADTTPRMEYDAMELYEVESQPTEDISFNVASNTPWKISIDCGDTYAGKPWCTASPLMSAVSSLTETVTVKMSVNTSYDERQASITITGEGIDVPKTISIRQMGLVLLQVSPLTPASVFDTAGGSATFTVKCNRAWTAESDQTWLTLDKTTGEADSREVTVTATAAPADGLSRRATITVKTDMLSKTIEVVQDGLRLEYRPLQNPDEETTFSYNGGERTYYVDSNIDWAVSCDDDNVTATKLDNESFSLKIGPAKSLSDKTFCITIHDTADGSALKPQTMTVTQQSPVVVESGIFEDNTLTAASGTARLKTRENYKYGIFEWTFSEVNLTTGYFSINNWGRNIYFMLQFGPDKHQIGAGGLVECNSGRKVNFGRTDGWDGGWNVGYQFDQGTYPAPSEMKKLKVVMEPTGRKLNANPLISRKIYINDLLVCDDSTWGGDVWADSDEPGLYYLFGIENCSGDFIKLESFSFTPLNK